MTDRLKALREKYPNLYSSLEALEIRDGWLAIVERLSATLERLILLEPEASRSRYRATRVKEKFGWLRFYLEKAGTPEMMTAIAETEAASAKTCETCGAPGETGKPRDPGRAYTLCDAHFREEAARTP